MASRRAAPAVAAFVTACTLLDPLDDIGTGSTMTPPVPSSDAGLDAPGDETTAPEEPPPNVTDVVAGLFHSCALLEDGRLKCWGRNDEGQLGLNDRTARGDRPETMGSALPAVDLAADAPIVALAAGAGHTCARLDDGSVRCWGRNQEGQLGLGDPNHRGDGPNEVGAMLPAIDLGPGRKAVEIAAGRHHTCARLDDGSVRCWGRNQEGQLGLGNADARGDNPGEMGSLLPPIDLGPGRTAVAIAAGSYHTCAILDDASLKCWGRNADGELGLGDKQNRGDGPGEMGSALDSVDLGTGRTALAVSAGNSHTCALLDDHSVKCWGLNVFGQLGLGDTNNRGDAAGEMGDDLPAVDLGPGRTAKSVVAGYEMTCAILDDDRLKCWGSNKNGRLGLGDAVDRGVAAGQMGSVLPAVDLGTGRKAIKVSAGAHVCALLDDRSVKCWGENGYGDIGAGDLSHRGDEPGEMGDALAPVRL